VRRGDAAKEIVGLTFDVGADLLVLGPHRSGSRTATRIIGLSDVPVLVHKGDSRAYGRILVASDMSESSALAVRTAAAWADAMQSELVVVHAFDVPVPTYGDSDGLDRARAKARAELSKALQWNGHAELIRSARLVDGEPVDAIARTAADTQADLVVLGSHGRTGLSRLLLGSVAERVLAEERTSVLVVRGGHE
jgi:nucleotide-binding universal stress UspA family protein